VQTEEPTLGDTSIVSQSVTNNRCAPHVRGGSTRQKNFCIVPPYLQIASNATVSKPLVICVCDRESGIGICGLCMM